MDSSQLPRHLPQTGYPASRPAGGDYWTAQVAIIIALFFLWIVIHGELQDWADILFWNPVREPRVEDAAQHGAVGAAGSIAAHSATGSAIEQAKTIGSAYDVVGQFIKKVPLLGGILSKIWGAGKILPAYEAADLGYKAAKGLGEIPKLPSEIYQSWPGSWQEAYQRMITGGEIQPGQVPVNPPVQEDQTTGIAQDFYSFLRKQLFGN